jgi:hypothetical protein
LGKVALLNKILLHDNIISTLYKENDQSILNNHQMDPLQTEINTSLLSDDQSDTSLESSNSAASISSKSSTSSSSSSSTSSSSSSHSIKPKVIEIVTKADEPIKPIQIPRGLNKNKKNAVSKMKNITATHCRFDDPIVTCEDEQMNYIEHLPQPDENNFENPFPNVIFSEVSLYDSTFKNKAAKKKLRDLTFNQKQIDNIEENSQPKPLSKGARRRLRREKLSMVCDDIINDREINVEYPPYFDKPQDESEPLAFESVDKILSEKKLELLEQVESVYNSNMKATVEDPRFNNEQLESVDKILLAKKAQLLERVKKHSQKRDYHQFLNYTSNQVIKNQKRVRNNNSNDLAEIDYNSFPLLKGSPIINQGNINA